jgi:hypothetical protein
MTPQTPGWLATAPGYHGGRAAVLGGSLVSLAAASSWSSDSSAEGRRAGMPVASSTFEDHPCEKRNPVGECGAHRYPPNPPLDTLRLGPRGPVRRGGCDVAEGAVTDSIEDPGGQVGGNGERS